MKRLSLLVMTLCLTLVFGVGAGLAEEKERPPGSLEGHV